MKRLLWLGVGLAVGALVVRAVTRKSHSFTPAGIAGSVKQSAAGLLDSVRDFADDVREGMAEREAEIHAAFTDGLLIDEHGDVHAYDPDEFEPGAFHHGARDPKDEGSERR